MKKIILFLLVIMSFGVSYSIAQSNTLTTSTIADHNQSNNDRKSISNEVVNYSEASTPKSYDIPKSAATFRLSSESGLLNIDVNNNVKYTKAELLSKQDNITVQSLQINESSSSVDISKVNAGTYYMILSNKEGDVFSEKITIL